jgi:uncharacterized membrane protein YiaA
MSFREYLHEKAEESRHNETLAYLMFLAGAVFFVGGILATLSLSEEPQWFLIIPYFTQSSSGTSLSLALLICGIALVFFGIAAGVNYSRDRGWYMQELKKAGSLEQGLMRKETDSKKNGRKKKTETT